MTGVWFTAWRCYINTLKNWLEIFVWWGGGEGIKAATVRSFLCAGKGTNRTSVVMFRQTHIAINTQIKRFARTGIISNNCCRFVFYYYTLFSSRRSKKSILCKNFDYICPQTIRICRVYYIRLRVYTYIYYVYTYIYIRAIRIIKYTTNIADSATPTSARNE